MEARAERLLRALPALELETGYEDDASRRIAEALGGSTQRCYPNSRERCDLVLHDDEGEVWIEVEFARTWVAPGDLGAANDRLREHLFDDGTSCALRDLSEKLPRLLRHPRIESVGLLLVALDSDALPFDEALISELDARADATASGWRLRSSEPWRSARYPGARLRAAYWESPAPVVASGPPVLPGPGRRVSRT